MNYRPNVTRVHTGFLYCINVILVMIKIQIWRKKHPNIFKMCDQEYYRLFIAHTETSCLTHRGDLHTSVFPTLHCIPWATNDTICPLLYNHDNIKQIVLVYPCLKLPIIVIRHLSELFYDHNIIIFYMILILVNYRTVTLLFPIICSPVKSYKTKCAIHLPCDGFKITTRSFGNIV